MENFPLIQSLRAEFDRPTVQLFHAIAKLSPKEPSLPGGDVETAFVDLARRTLWPNMVVFDQPVTVIASWVSTASEGEFHFFVSCPEDRDTEDEFMKVASRAWKAIPTTLYHPRPHLPFRHSPRQIRHLDKGDDWRWWLGFVYERLKTKGTFVTTIPGNELSPPIDSIHEVLYLTVDPFLASRTVLDLFERGAIVRPTDRQRTILEALGDNKLTGEKLAEKAGYRYNSAFKSELSVMVKLGMLIQERPGNFRNPQFQWSQASQ